MLCVHIVTYYRRALESLSDTQSRLVDALRSVRTFGRVLLTLLIEMSNRADLGTVEELRFVALQRCQGRRDWTSPSKVMDESVYFVFNGTKIVEIGHRIGRVGIA